MATTELKSVDFSAEIGKAAGKLWHHLKEHGPCTISSLVKSLEGTRDETMMAVGWLARENKLLFQERGRSKLISLMEE